MAAENAGKNPEKKGGRGIEAAGPETEAEPRVKRMAYHLLERRRDEPRRAGVGMVYLLALRLAGLHGVDNPWRSGCSPRYDFPSCGISSTERRSIS